MWYRVVIGTATRKVNPRVYTERWPARRHLFRGFGTSGLALAGTTAPAALSGSSNPAAAAVRPTPVPPQRGAIRVVQPEPCIDGAHVARMHPQRPARSPRLTSTERTK